MSLKNSNDNLKEEKSEQNIVYITPYNSLNVEIEINDIHEILTKYGVPQRSTIRNINLYKRAFIHQSYTKEHINKIMEKDTNIKLSKNKPENCLQLHSKSNERLEFLGDGLLELITKFYLYRRFPREDEGFMTNKKIAIVKNESIGKIAYEMGLHRWLIIAKDVEDTNMRTNLKKIGSLFEAFLGAIFLDFNQLPINDEAGWFNGTFICGPGFQMVQIFLENVLETHINWNDILLNDSNYKNILQVKIQKEFKVTPHYIEIESNENFYEMGVFLYIGRENICNLNTKTARPLTNEFNILEIHNYLKTNDSIFVLLAKGSHKIKKKAEQNACLNCLKIIDNELYKNNCL